jgi:nitronate monooxygenase
MVGFGGGRAEDLTREAATAAAGGKPYGIGLLAWVLEFQPELLETALAAGPALVSVSYGAYRPLVDRIHSAGVLCATQVGTVDEARAAEAAGVDVVVARGSEGGGHGRGVVGTLPLLQAVLDAVEAPVLAAGGIANGRGLAAVLAAGAAGAWVGTAFIACTESANDDDAKRAAIAAGETDTIYTTVLDMGRRVPWPAEFGGRAIRNAYADRWHGREAELEASGERLEEPVVWAGQGVGLVRQRHSAADIVRDLATADLLLRRAATGE